MKDATKKWTSSHTSGQFKVKYTPFQWARTSSFSSDQCIVYFFHHHLINKEFDVISFTNGYTDELAIKTKNEWILAVYFPQGVGNFFAVENPLERTTVIRRSSDPPPLQQTPTVSEELTSALRTSLSLLLKTRHLRLDPRTADTTTSRQHTLHNMLGQYKNASNVHCMSEEEHGTCTEWSISVSNTTQYTVAKLSYESRHVNDASTPVFHWEKCFSTWY